jgi:septum site-determining protein MinD
MTRVIGVVSGKGGVGKTVTTINLSAALMGFGKNVIAVDADVKMSGLGLQLGMYYFPITLNDVLMNRGNIHESLYIHSSGLRIIPASLSVENVKISKLKKVLKDPFLDDNIVFVDAPPGLEKNTLSVLNSCPEILIVTTPEIPSIADALKIICSCKKIKSKPIGLIINMYRGKDSKQVKIEEIEAICGLPVIGVIPEDNNIKKSVFLGIPSVVLRPYSSSSLAFKQIAAQIIGETFIPPKFAFIKNLFGGLK